VPADFSVDLAVLTAPDLKRPREAEARPARFVVFCDGSLHWGPRLDPGVDRLPPPRRTLTRRQIAEVWSLARQIGLADPALAGEVANLRLMEPQPGQVVYVAIFTGRGDRWTHVRRLDADEPIDPAWARFVRHLAGLSWAGEPPPEPVRAAPRRYDFGPDPYARYRRP
jgi:hypothetical protein